MGRFISPDTIVPLAFQGVQAWDRYAYGNNNPLYYTDPSGHMASACGVDGSECGDAEQKDWNYFNARYNQQQCDSGQLEGCNSVGGVLAFTAVGLVTAGAGQAAIEAAAGPILEIGSTATSAACADGDCSNEFNAVEQIVQNGLNNIQNGIGQAFNSFSQFKQNYGSAGPLQQWHHIVEQNPGNIAQFGQAAIQNTSNLINLPTGIHQAISGYYSSANIAITGPGFSTVRQWVQTQDFEAQWSFGMDIIRQFGGSLYIFSRFGG